MNNIVWLGGTALALAAATLGVVGLLAHLDQARVVSVIAFDVLWIAAALVAGNICWRRTTWSDH